MKIDLTSPVPLYVQIAELVKAERLVGHWRAGDRVPPVRDLALALRINPNTVAKAYKRLQDEGVLEGRPGGGNYIVPQSSETMEAERSRRFEIELELFLQKTDALGIPREEIPERIHKKILKGNNHA